MDFINYVFEISETDRIIYSLEEEGIEDINMYNQQNIIENINIHNQNTNDNQLSQFVSLKTQVVEISNQPTVLNKKEEDKDMSEDIDIKASEYIENIINENSSTIVQKNDIPNIELVNWFKDGYKILKRGKIFKLTDLKTGITINCKVVGGYNHADYEPLTEEDTKLLKQIYNDKWSWDRRSVVIEVDGRKIAGSTNGMPHGYETVTNNGMNGQVCVHLYMSKTHGSNEVDKKHQEMIIEAYETGK